MVSELEAYKQAYERERKARKVAEHLLDVKSRQLYESLQSLEKSAAELVENNLQLQSTEQQLIRAEKLASIGQLATGVAHEINNPVGFVLSNLETTKGYFSDVTELIDLYRQFIETLKANALEGEASLCIGRINSFEQQNDIDFLLGDIQDVFTESSEGLVRVKDIVANLRTISHTGETELQNIDVNACLENALKLVMNEIKYTVDVEVDLCPTTIIKGIQSELTQVFTNLLLNACHACGRKGVVKVKSEATKTALNINIIDDGCGIPKKLLHKIFDPFFTTKPVGKGTGLGLSISLGIIEKHDGTISIFSKPDSGTTVIISFPISTQS